MKITHGTFWVNLQNEEISEDITAPEEWVVTDTPAETEFWDGADVSDQLAFATIKVNAATEDANLGKILKEIIDALSKLAIAQGVPNPVVKFEVVKEKADNATQSNLGKMKHIPEISVNDFMTKFEQ
ncbi:hypothetical protein L0663_04990 [Dyadobacter sp. CY107]|uniref:hypothetical protein n=1 Tax=Dyadobacter fanqingshengii TaxID=2906443 RepID=UPI001F42F023|nr:hypothetical protein [Dyadobacter fanqingshengii]MCF2502722.1 hypothetical protein [Dyadobacter fanqingshengii]